MLTILTLPTMFDALCAQSKRKPVIVIAECRDGRTYIGNTAIGIYDHGIYTRLLPDGWTCGVGEAAAVVYEALERECASDETAPVGFYTTRTFREVNILANYAIRSLVAHLEGVAA